MKIFQYFFPVFNLYAMADHLSENKDFLKQHEGLKVRFESVNYPNHFIRHRDSTGYIDLWGSNGGVELFEQDSAFYVQKGLSGAKNSVSLRSVNYPEYFLTNINGIIKIEKVSQKSLLIEDSTWIIEDGNWPSEDESISFKYKDDSKKFIRHQDFQLKLHEDDDKEIFQKDSSFIVHKVTEHYQYDGYYPSQYAWDLDEIIRKNFKSNAGKNYADKRLSRYMHNITRRLGRFYFKFNCGPISPSKQKRTEIVNMTCDELKDVILDVNNWNQHLLGPCKQNLADNLGRQLSKIVKKLTKNNRCEKFMAKNT